MGRKAKYATPEERRAAELARARAYYAANKEKFAARSRALYEATREEWIARSKRNYKKWAADNPERLSELKRGYANAKRYGITPDQFAEMLMQQNGLCAICEQPPTRRGLCVDHHHESKVVRQLLCVNCNAMLGHAREDVRVLRRAEEYLRSHAHQRAA